MGKSDPPNPLLDQVTVSRHHCRRRSTGDREYGTYEVDTESHCSWLVSLGFLHVNKAALKTRGYARTLIVHSREQT